MRRTEMLQEIRKMRFEEMYMGWQKGKLSQEEAARVLGVCPRTFRRQIGRYESSGLEGLNDKRLTQASHRRAPVDEVMRLTQQYRSRYRGWNVKHFHEHWHAEHGGTRSYTWTKNRLQAAGQVARAPRRGRIARSGRASPCPA